MSFFYKQRWRHCNGLRGPVGHTFPSLPTDRGKVFIFVGKKLLQLELSAVSFNSDNIFAKKFASPQNKAHYFSIVLGNRLWIKIVKTFMMNYKQLQLLRHFMFSIEGKGGLRKPTWKSRVSACFGKRDNLL